MILRKRMADYTAEKVVKKLKDLKNMGKKTRNNKTS